MIYHGEHGGHGESIRAMKRLALNTFGVVSFLSLFPVSPVFPVVNSTRAAEPTYWQDVRPVLRKHCFACHTKRNIKEVEVSAGLAMDSYDTFLKPVGRKRVVLPGKSGESELIRRVTSKDDDVRMPPATKPLPDEAVTL